jgi:hypothetical protein
MQQAHEISFGSSKKCVLKSDEGTVHPAADPELTLSSYPVQGLEQGELFIDVTRTSMPAIVKVEVREQGTSLRRDEIEQIRKAAEGIFLGQIG